MGQTTTTLTYRDLQVPPEVYHGNKVLTTYFTLKNTGKVVGAEVALVSVRMPASVNEASKRLVAFKKVY